jgi:hypothetical protein
MSVARAVTRLTASGLGIAFNHRVLAKERLVVDLKSSYLGRRALSAIWNAVPSGFMGWPGSNTKLFT